MSAPDRLNYDIIDVFTLASNEPFTGNALAVVYGAEQLTTKQMQTITNQFNLSETTFPMFLNGKKKEGGNEYDVRIFSIDEELPFAGHPTIGTSYALLSRSLLDGSSSTAPITQHCKAGPIAITAPSDLTTEPVFLSAPLRALSPLISPSSSLITELLETLSLPSDTPLRPEGVRISSCGLPFLHVQFEREADVEEARGNPGGVRALLGKTKEACGYEASGIYAFYAERAEEGNERGADLRVHARMFYTDFGEDSATGSAAVSLGAVLLHSFKLPSNGTSTYVVSQGVEMRRPALLIGKVKVDSQESVTCLVGGTSIKVGEGWIAVPPLEV